ncbi:putative chromate transport protein [Candidatus Phycosocius bacilliformis]|uniref:Putative chromate transport protein n=2 Tax=Candidatus Phycosocius bacilliformis TaxID=1445552 RepID=A0A2P2EDY1_9PROT|nr:putative chromate transport protein [Candidatus Phycosocius bacilliformis]
MTMTVAHPSFKEAFYVFARIGFLSFGGPAGQIALMHKLLVDEKRWLDEDRFLHALSYCMLLPGPEAHQLAIYSGWLLHGIRGGIMAGLLFVLPGFLVILALAATYALFQGHPAIHAVFFGVKAAVVVIVLDALVRVARRALHNQIMWLIAAASFLALSFLALPFPLLILIVAVGGLVGGLIRPDVFRVTGHAAAKAGEGPFLKLDVPVPQGGWRYVAQIAGVGIVVWLAPVVALVLALGGGHIFSQIAIYFSQMAVVTFGGAYAVLAWVSQAAVDQFGWLTSREMMDGLALAETTPGPLILVLAYVGFLAAFRDAGGLDPVLAGVLGAGLTAWVTFIPSFIFIFVGAPWIEKFRANVALSGGLAAITAAVVGVIGNLAVWFGLHVLFAKVETTQIGILSFANPNVPSFQPAAFILTLMAGVLLFRAKLGVIPLLGACAVLGLLVQSLPFA